MSNNRVITSNNLNYSHFSEKYYNYDTFKLAIRPNILDILAFIQCSIQLEIRTSYSSKLY